MRKKIISLSLLVGLLAVSSSCQKQGQGKVSLKTDEDKTLYTIGHMFGGRLKNLSLNEHEVETIISGLRDSANGKKDQVDVASFQGKVQVFFRSRMAKASESIKTEGQKYLEDFVKKEGATKTTSGLAYKILKAGSAKKAKSTDTVKVHYHGTLINGDVFDSSVDRGKEVSFPLNRVIKGWTEGLQLVGEGGKIKLVIPSELAYGDHGAPPKIPGGSTLTFIVELFTVSDTKAAIPAKGAPKLKAAPVKKAKKK